MMKLVTTAFFWVNLSQVALAQTTGTNTQIHQQEDLQKQIDSNRQEVNNATVTPNSSSAPTKVETSTWGIDPNVKFEITNHGDRRALYADVGIDFRIFCWFKV